MTERREIASPGAALYRLSAGAADQVAATGPTGARTGTPGPAGVSVARLVAVQVG